MSEAYVTIEKRVALEERMARLGIREQDLIEKFILGAGSGGQKINKTSSCVYLRHSLSGIEVKCQRERSRELNRFMARRELCDQLEQKRLGLKSARQEMEKVRRQKRRRSRRQKERMLDDKHRHSSKKQTRRSHDFES